MAGLGGREMAQQASWWLPVDDHVEEFFSPSVITHKMVVSFLFLVVFYYAFGLCSIYTCLTNIAVKRNF